VGVLTAFADVDSEEGAFALAWVAAIVASLFDVLVDVAVEASAVDVVDWEFSAPGWLVDADDELAISVIDAVGLVSVSALSLILRECSKMSWVMMASIRTNNHI
jgi:hypothetical protein